MVQGVNHRAADLIFKPRSALRRPVEDTNIVKTPFRGDDRGVGKQRGDTRGVHCGGHHENPQIVAQRGTGVKRKRKSEIGMNAPFMELVENQQGNPLQGGIVLDHARQNSLRDDLDACLRPGNSFKTGAVSGPLPGLFPEQVCDSHPCAPGGDPARFQHQDFPAAQKGGVQKRGRHHRALARSGSGAENRTAAVFQSARQIVQNGFDGQAGIQAHARTSRRSVSMTSTARPRRKISVMEFV